MKRLFVISDDNEEQAVAFAETARALGADVFHLQASGCGITWDLIGDQDGIGITCDDQIFDLNSAENCFYWRAPYNHNYSTESPAFALLYEQLSGEPYTQGNYFNGPASHSWEGCKFYNLGLAGTLPTPRTFVGNFFPADLAPGKVITKSISALRSEVVAADDPRLKLPADGQAGLISLLQEKVGTCDIKVNVYVTRKGELKTFATKVGTTGCVDYRFSDSFSVEEWAVNDSLIDLARDIHSRTDSRFFDFDLRLADTGEIWFLEANFSPAPIGAEDLIPGFNRRFTKSMLEDWLQ